MEYIIGSVLIVFSLIIIFVVLLQEGRQANVGVISGAADSFMDKGAAKTLDQKLSKWTKVIAVTFFVLVLAGMLVTNYLANKPVDSEVQAPSTNSSTTNDGELTWDDTDKKDEDKKEEDKKEESDKKDDADKKEESDKKDTADKKN